MDFQGSHTFSASQQQVWNAITNPTVLKESIPGAQSVAVDGNTLHVTIQLDLPLIKGSYSVDIEMLNSNPPNQLTLGVDRSGGFGSIKGQTVVNFAAAGSGTNANYNAHVELGGKIGMTPSMMVEPVVKKMVDTFLSNLDKNIK